MLSFVLAALLGAAPAPTHGVPSALSTAAKDAELCEHKVPKQACTRHNPALIPSFKAANDWCGEHDVPESQCFLCHPGLTFTPLPNLPPGADVAKLSQAGEDVPSLDAAAVKGKVTIFDFYADWCVPCRQIDAHVFRLLNERQDIALRKLNVVSWDTPLAKRYLRRSPSLPYVVIYGKDGERVAVIKGPALDELDAAIAKAAAR